MGAGSEPVCGPGGSSKGALLVQACYTDLMRPMVAKPMAPNAPQHTDAMLSTAAGVERLSMLAKRAASATRITTSSVEATPVPNEKAACAGSLLPALQHNTNIVPRVCFVGACGCVSVSFFCGCAKAAANVSQHHCDAKQHTCRFHWASDQVETAVTIATTTKAIGSPVRDTAMAGWCL